ncbi:MAG: hypothetical protein ABIF82_01630 [Planctomycetota bacterium]
MSDGTLVERIRAAGLKRRQRAAIVYCDALLKGSLQEGDEEQVAAAMETLKRSADDLNGDVELVQRLAQFGELAGQAETVRVDLGRKRVSLSDAQREYKEACAKLEGEWEPKLAKMRQGVSQIEGRLQDALAADRELATLQAQWDAIVSGE